MALKILFKSLSIFIILNGIAFFIVYNLEGFIPFITSSSLSLLGFVLGCGLLKEIENEK